MTTAKPHLEETKNMNREQLCRASRRVGAMVVSGLLWIVGVANAAVVFYQDRAVFIAALAGAPLTAESYETYALSDIALGGRRGDFLYQFDPTAVQPAVVADGAGGQALGGSPFDVFVGGDVVQLRFQPLALKPGLIAFGADFSYAPSGPDIPPDTYRLGIEDGAAVGQFGGNAANLDLAGATFFLGVIADSALLFTSVSLSSVQTDPGFLVPAYQVDNLVFATRAATVAEPVTLWMLMLGLLSSVAIPRRLATRVSKLFNHRKE
jgi:hypothetical protein